MSYPDCVKTSCITTFINIRHFIQVPIDNLHCDTLADPNYLTTKLKSLNCPQKNLENICSLSSCNIFFPSYCTPEKAYDSERETLNYFHLNEEPHATFEGHASWAWLHEKKIVGAFLYTLDTTIRKFVIEVTDEDCWKIVNSKDYYTVTK